MLIEQKVTINWSQRIKSHYVKLGYVFSKNGDQFQVNVEDLPKGSHEEIKLICDYCGCEFPVMYKTYIKQKTRNTIKKDCCLNCRPKKIEEFSIGKYGNKSKRFTFEFVKLQFLNNGLELLENEYISARTKMRCFCPAHPDIIQEYTYNHIQRGQRCKYCSWDNLSKERRYDFEYVLNEFTKRGFNLLEQEYINVKLKLQFICEKHNYHIQETTFDNLQLGGGCKYCRYEKVTGENNHFWKGGITDLSNYLRGKLTNWKKESMKASKYRCVITNKRFDVIHHLYGFDLILEEILKELKLPLHEKINEYRDVELISIEDMCLKLHAKYGVGVCLTDEIHNEFHTLYGFGRNTPQQFEEYKKMKFPIKTIK